MPGEGRVSGEFSKRGNTLSDRRNPYVTVVAVWIASSFGLALVISFPIFPVVLFSVVFLVLAVIGYLVYEAYHKDPNNRDLSKNLLSEWRRFILKIFEDFGIVFSQVSAWWLRREVRIREEMAQERERKARKKEKLAQWKQKRRGKPGNYYLPTERHEDVRRGSQEERTEN